MCTAHGVCEHAEHAELTRFYEGFASCSSNNASDSYHGHLTTTTALVMKMLRQLANTIETPLPLQGKRWISLPWLFMTRGCACRCEGGACTCGLHSAVGLCTLPSVRLNWNSYTKSLSLSLRIPQDSTTGAFDCKDCPSKSEAAGAARSVLPGEHWDPLAPARTAASVRSDWHPDRLPTTALTRRDVLPRRAWNPLAPTRTVGARVHSDIRATVAAAIGHVLQASPRNRAAPARVADQRLQRFASQAGRWALWLRLSDRFSLGSVHGRSVVIHRGILS